MYIKINQSNDAVVVALCDEYLINKTFEEGQLQLKVTEIFYKGEKKSEEEIIKILKGSNNINIVGEESIRFALDNNLINKDSIIRIANIPHAQVVSR